MEEDQKFKSEIQIEKEVIQVIKMSDKEILVKKESPAQSSAIKYTNQGAIPGKREKASKRKALEKTSDDEEEGFAGFDKSEIKEDVYLKKIRTDSSSENEHASPSKKIVVRTDPAFQLPFTYGWKRELVLRAEPIMSKEKGEVYYITPGGKKLRTRHEIQNHLHDDLTINNFTLVKEAIGAAPEHEIIRSAKYYNFARRSANEITPPEPAPILGKRTPKPKLPKGASPPPPSVPISRQPAVNRVQTSHSNSKQSPKVTNAKENHKSPIAGSSKTPVSKTKAKGACTIQCLAAMGKIPQLQCKSCLCLYHPECIQITPIAPGIYMCENCKKEKSPLAKPTTIQEPKIVETPIPPTKKQQQLLSKALSNSNAPKSHNFNKNPQTIISCKNNKFIVFESSTAVDDEKRINSFKRKLNEDFNKSTNVKTPAKAVNEVARPGASKGKPVTAVNSVPSAIVSPFNFSTNFFQNVASGYNILFQTFQYLKVQELQRASCVCRMWNQVANHRNLWHTVRMKNSHVNDWEGFVRTLKRHGTKHLDLRKMLMGNQEEAWREFSARIGACLELKAIDLCRCQSSIVETLFKTSPHLKVINAVSLKDDTIDLSGLLELQHLEELRLRSNHANGVTIVLERPTVESNQIEKIKLSELSIFENMTHLSLTTVQNLQLLLDDEKNSLRNLGKLETLELGYLEHCNDNMFAQNITHLKNLKRLRLEKGSLNFNINIILNTIAKSLPSVMQLELINCDIKTGFEDALKKCVNLKKLLLCPTYVSQSAATNFMILKGVMQLSTNLEMFVWVVTNELLRVTELYVDQCDNKADKLTKRSPEKMLSSPLKNSDCIPILKPVPGLDDETLMDEKTTAATASDVPQKVEIIQLKTVENILGKHLALSKFKLLKISHANTWKQTMLDLP